MNNNDILNILHNSGQDVLPSERLDPAFVEDSLSGIKRKKNKPLITTCVTLGVACLTVATVFITQSFNTNPYAKVYKTVEEVKKANTPSFFSSLFDYIKGDYGYGGIYNSLDSAVTEDFLVGNSTSTGTEHSETNVQVKGVDEADVTKTDGRYIYSVDDKRIIITNPNNGKPEYVTSVDTGYDISEFYINGNQLVVVASGMDISEKTSTDDTALKIDTDGTSVFVYDISDISSPKKISALAQSGDCISTRKIGNVVYLTTNYSVNNLRRIKENDPQTYCPIYSTPDEVSCVDAENISICETVSSVDYVTVASIDLENPTEFADMCSVLGGGENIYASLENIYIASYEWSENGTQIMRFSIDGTEIEENGSFVVEGDILNQFSMDEHNGYFRVVVEKDVETQFVEAWDSISTSESAATLCVFDSDLKLVGETEDVGRGERVKSVRFDGDIAYFVTFRQTDPLFTVDLSNPENPVVLSELKIPGFSEYLHVMSKDHLLGIGREADELSGFQEGLKISMFDTSDKSDVSELATMIFTDDDVQSEAEYNHKAVYVDEENYIIGIPYWSYDDYNKVYYAVFKYDTENNKFVQLKNIEETSDGEDFFDYDSYIRGVRIGDNFYVVANENVFAYNYSDFEKTGEVNFD